MVAWVNLCKKKDSTRRPGFEGVPPFGETPEVARNSPSNVDFCLEGGIEVKGLHIIADLYNCQKGTLLVSSRELRELCVRTCKEVGLTVLGDHFYQFDGLQGGQDGGATGAVVLAESHLAIHTWPERDGATLDVYVCNFTADNTAI